MPNDEYSRPATLEDLKRVIRTLNSKDAKYLLVGGYALFAHGYHRATEDIDLLVPAKSSASAAILDSLLVLADKESANIDPSWFDDGQNIRLADEIIVDLDGVPEKTLNLAGLLNTKQSDREKDVLVRLVLEKVLDALRADNKSKTCPLPCPRSF